MEPSLHERHAGGSTADHARFVRAWAELGLDAAPPPREAFACQLAPHAFFLETRAGELAAYALCRGFGARGDVRQIVVMPGFRGRGVGTQLMAAVATRLRRAGCRDWRLEVRAGNDAAIALYRRVGMEVRRPLTVLRLELPVVAHPLDDLRPDEDAGYEEAFDLGRGFLAYLRARRPELPLHVLPGGAGLTRWMPDYSERCGLLFPFRVRRVEDVPALLAAGSGEVELMATDEGVAEVLQARGARVHERMLEMGGRL